jgi:hypothetical protein
MSLLRKRTARSILSSHLRMAHSYLIKLCSHHRRRGYQLRDNVSMHWYDFYYVSLVKNTITYLMSMSPSRRIESATLRYTLAHDRALFTVRNSAPSSDSRSLGAKSPKGLVHMYPPDVKITTHRTLETRHRGMGVSLHRPSCY